MKLRVCLAILSFISVMVCTIPAQTAQSNPTPASSPVPRLIKFSGIAKDQTGKPMSGILGVTFMLYKDPQDGSPLWMETQNVQADAAGHYTALLGSASTDGVPLELFSSADAHWISSQISGEPEQARKLLLSVPYALKAADAETLGGLPASAFVQTNSAEAPGSAATAKPANAKSNAATAAITGSGTTDYIPLWTSASALGSSILFQTGGNVGVGTKTPGAKLDTDGTAIAVRGTSSGATGTGVLGKATSATGVNFGVQGQTASTAAGSAGVSGNDTAVTGQVYGVFGSTNSRTTNAMGVSGYEGAAKGQVYGVDGYNVSTGPFAAGVGGFEGATTGQVFGVTGGASSTTNGSAGINGNESATTGVVYGVSGSTNSTTSGAAGISGNEGATTGQVYGVFGSANSTTTNAMGVSGYEGATTGQVYGVNGNTSSNGAGAAGVNGYASATTGQVYGVSGNAASTNGSGVFGYASAATGSTVGVFGQSASSGGVGVLGKTVTAGGTAGQFVNYAGSGLILQGQSGTSFEQVFSVDASGNGFYAGNLNVTGTVTKGGGSFKIDHPLDPANKYLSHSFVESPDMMNVYNGNITTDNHGQATVVLPDYFGALNQDFRYQLTVIGQFAQAIVKREIENNRFTIKTNKPSVKVSWQVTGIRHDAYANAYRIPVEENKPAAEQGDYLHPELFGQPESKSVAAAQKSASTTDRAVADASHR